MKKYIGIALAVLMILGLSGMVLAGTTQTFNFSCTVQKHIEVNPACAVINASLTIPGFGSGSVPVVTEHGGCRDAAYANCPFTVSFVGNNPASDNLPILARLETSTTNRYDRLQTIIQIRYYINLPWGTSGWEGHHMDFLSGPDGTTVNTWTGQTLTFVNYPHDGEIYMDWHFGASLPHLSPDFGPDNTWQQSADAGLYTCNVTATFAVV